MVERKKNVAKESHTRTVVKSISWRVVATLTTMVIVYIFTGEALTSLGVGFFEVLAKITFYYLHERAWNRISWGQPKHPLAHIPITKDVSPEDMDKIKEYLRSLGYID
jgi:uncharacterized membrane protein